MVGIGSPLDDWPVTLKSLHLSSLIPGLGKPDSHMWKSAGMERPHFWSEHPFTVGRQGGSALVRSRLASVSKPRHLLDRKLFLDKRKGWRILEVGKMLKFSRD